MRRHLIFTFSLVLVSLSCVFGQDEEESRERINAKSDSLQQVIDEEEFEAGYFEPAERDSVVNYPFFSAGAFLLDYGKLAGMVMETESKFEIGVQAEFKNLIVLVADFGTATLEPNGAYQNAAYSSEGSYYRLGLGVKYDLNAKNNFFFTVRYGRSSYADKGLVTIQSPSGLYDTFQEPFDRETTTATWYEAVLSSETRMWKGLYLGFHLRLRIMHDYEKREPLDVYSIPGYGRTIDNSIPAFNLYVKYAFERFKD